MCKGCVCVCATKLCVCDKVACETVVCVCDDMLCVCVKVLCVKELCVTKLAGQTVADRGRTEADGAGGRLTGVHNKKQEPHTKMWRKTHHM